MVAADSGLAIEGGGGVLAESERVDAGGRVLDLRDPDASGPLIEVVDGTLLVAEGRFGAPAMGVDGAAWSSVVSTWVGLGFLAFAFWRGWGGAPKRTAPLGLSVRETVASAAGRAPEVRRLTVAMRVGLGPQQQRAGQAGAHDHQQSLHAHDDAKKFEVLRVRVGDAQCLRSPHHQGESLEEKQQADGCNKLVYRRLTGEGTKDHALDEHSYQGQNYHGSQQA